MDKAIDSDTYASEAQRYLLGGIAYVRDLAATAVGPLPPDVCEQALHTIALALREPAAWPQARALLEELAPRLEQAGLRDEWMAQLVRGIEISCNLGDLEAEGTCVLHLAFLQQLRGDLPAAQARLEGGQGSAEEAQNHFVRGVVACSRGEWAAAEQEFQAALRLWQEGGRAQPRMVAWSLLNLGTALRRLGRPEEATACYRQAIDMLDELGDFVHAALARNNLGNIYLDCDEPAAALACFQQAEPIFRSVQDQLRLALVYTNQGVAWQALGDFGQAGRYLAATIAPKTRRTRGSCMPSVGRRGRQRQPGAADYLLWDCAGW